MEYESKNLYYVSADKMAEDGFFSGKRWSWSGAWGAIVDFAEVVPTIGDLPRAGWRLAEEFSAKQDRYVVTGIKTPDLFIGLSGNVSMRRDFKIEDPENNEGRPYFTPRRPLTAEESAFAAETMTRLLTAKDAAAKRQAEMVARINAGELSEEDCE